MGLVGLELGLDLGLNLWLGLGEMPGRGMSDTRALCVTQGGGVK